VTFTTRHGPGLMIQIERMINEVVPDEEEGLAESPVH
jgi:hypothetical protein